MDLLDNVKNIDFLLNMLEKKKFKKKLIKKINKSVDIPMINEDTEKKIIDTLYDLIIEVIRDIDLDNNH